jgi:tetratricopeptide (TPR) repeat protein
MDVDGNGTVDVVLRGIPCDFGEVNDTGPWRFYTIILTWNGAKFQLLPMHLDPPEYRFQAVQDGDLETWRGNYAGAIKLYRQALEDKSLKGWSIDRYRQQGERIQATYEVSPVPTQYPSDPNEYAVLSAYIHYRFLLIDSAQGNLDQARADLASFQKEVQPGQPGYDYLTLASVFWSTYQDAHDLATACIKTRQYANDHREAILEPINDAWHGWQSPGHTGEPTEEQVICPFE